MLRGSWFYRSPDNGVTFNIITSGLTVDNVQLSPSAQQTLLMFICFMLLMIMDMAEYTVPPIPGFLSVFVPVHQTSLTGVAMEAVPADKLV